MRWNTPLSDSHAELLLQRLDLPAASHLLDLGCGWGELLLRAVDAAPTEVTGTGVDVDEALLTQGRALAADRSLDARVRFVAHDAADWREPADRVLCVGAAHALGGTVDALRALTHLVSPGGRLLFGEVFWQQSPTAELIDLFGDQTGSLADLVEQARVTGWRVLHLSTADQREWDDFESSWLAGSQEWLLANPADPQATEVGDELDSRLRQYVGGYRGILGLGYLVLGRPRAAAQPGSGDESSPVLEVAEQ